MNIYDEAFNELLHISELLRKMPLQYSPSTYKINDALLRAKKVEELLDLYRLQQEFKERYNTQVRVLDRQETLDDIREITEEIYLKEKRIGGTEMKVTVHKDLKLTKYENVVQVTVMVTEECKELDMPQETIIHILEKNGDKKTKTAFLCDSCVTLTVLDDPKLEVES